MMKRSGSIMRKRIVSVLLAALMCLAMLPDTAVFANGDVVTVADDEAGDSSETGESARTDGGNTLTVNASATEAAGSTYTTIQPALDYINNQSDKDGWTINIKSGTYTYFTVNQYISNLTITGEAGVTVDCSGGSIQLMGDTITLEGITFTAENTAWSVPVIKDASSNAGLYYDSMVTIKNCDFVGDNAGCALWICRLNATVQNCTFDGFSYAIEIINETSTAAKIDTETTTGTITIDGNIVTNCDFFIHYGVRSEISLVVTSNYVKGSVDEVCASLFAWEGVSITVTGNLFEYAAFGLQNAINNVSAKDFLDTNSFICSYVADDYYDYSTGADYSVTYYAPEGSGLVWAVSETGITDNEMAEKFAAALEGHESDNPLTFTTTAGKGDLVCMGLAYQALILVKSKPSEPDLTKSIVESKDVDGKTVTSEVSETSARAGETVNFKLTSVIPSTLQDYIDYEYDEEQEKVVGTVKTVEGVDGELVPATYQLTFYDEMDSKLTLNNDSIEVLYVINATDNEGNPAQVFTELNAQYYTVTYPTSEGDTCTFEITIDLLKLYTDEVIDESAFGKNEIAITYSATLNSEITPGAYDNTAWVTYPDGESEIDTVTVNTYGISIFKYDQSSYKSTGTDTEADDTNTSEADDETSSDTPVTAETATPVRTSEGIVGLKDAVFTIYSDADCTKVVTTLTSDKNGYATSSLAAGTYYLKETTAPNSYVSSNSVIKITIAESEDEDTGYVLNENTYFVYVDMANAAIPDTGGMGTTIFRIVGGCLLLAAVIVFIVSRRRRDDDEE